MTLANDRLFNLSNPYPVDGRVSWHTPSARGVAPMNLYVLREPDEDLLIDTGLSIHRAQVLAGLRALGVATEGRRFSIMTLRSGEFDSICNLGPIARNFPISEIHSFHPDGIFWGDLDPDSPFDVEHDASINIPDPSSISGLSTIQIGQRLTRPIEIIKPELRLLYTNWLYDGATKTLFTSDSFTWVIRPGDPDASDDHDGPWIVRADQDTTTESDVREHLLTTRFWWLSGADVRAIRTQLADLFSTRNIERVAPSFGCILEGPEMVERHYQMLDAILVEQGAQSEMPSTNEGGNVIDAKTT